MIFSDLRSAAETKSPGPFSDTCRFSISPRSRFNPRPALRAVAVITFIRAERIMDRGFPQSVASTPLRAHASSSQAERSPMSLREPDEMMQQMNMRARRLCGLGVRRRVIPSVSLLLGFFALESCLPGGRQLTQPDSNGRLGLVTALVFPGGAAYVRQRATRLNAPLDSI